MPYRVFKCPSSNCNFSGNQQEFISHILQQHGSLLIQRYHYLFNDQSAFDDMIATRLNENNKKARLGETGKYYCEVYMGKCKSRPCCDGYCGPTNGCNCLACMKLDIQARKLPPGYLVNRNGFVARRSPETGLFYCGRRVLDGVPGCDGYCGPTNGPNCRACKVLDVETKSGGRYESLIK